MKFRKEIKKILMPLEYYTLDEKIIFEDRNYKADCDFTDKFDYLEKVFVYECNSYTNEDLIDMYCDLKNFLSTIICQLLSKIISRFLIIICVEFTFF